MKLHVAASLCIIVIKLLAMTVPLQDRVDREHRPLLGRMQVDQIKMDNQA